MDMLRRGAARVASLGSSDDFVGREVQIGGAAVRIRSVIAEGAEPLPLPCVLCIFPTVLCENRVACVACDATANSCAPDTWQPAIVFPRSPLMSVMHITPRRAVGCARTRTHRRLWDCVLCQGGCVGTAVCCQASQGV
jgi:hypothetical protein